MIPYLRSSLLVSMLLVCAGGGAAEAVLRTPAAFSVGEHPIVGLHGAALDSDRLEDLIIVTTHAIVLAGATGDGTFVERQRFITDGHTWASAISEPMADGMRELAVASVNEGQVTLVAYVVGAGNAEPIGRAAFVGDVLAMSVVDTDGDRIPDVVGTSGGTAFLCLGVPGGGLAPVRWFSEPYRRVFLGDVDGDGLAEVLATDGSNTLVHTITGSGTVYRATIPVGGQRVTTADTNGDGKPDVIFDGQYWFTVVRATGTNAWAAREEYSIYPSDGTPQIALQDVDADGITDVVAMEGPRLAVHLGQRGASLRQVEPSLAGSRLTHLTFGDFDGDGHADAAWSGDEPGQFHVARGNGDGTFATYPFHRFEVGIGGFSWAQKMRLFVTDLSSDSFPDVIAFGGRFPHIEGLRNDGHGGFRERVGIPLEEGSQLIGVADVDRDGKGDLVTADEGTVAIHAGRGDMTFAAPVRISMPAALAGVADFDGDGAVDLVDATGTVRLNDGNGGFGAAVANPGTLNGCTDFLFGDISGDGASDVVCTDGDFVTVVIHERNGTFPAPITYYANLNRPTLGDVNGDALADIVDVAFGETTVLLSRGDGTFYGWQLWATGLNPVFGDSTETTIADFDGDGLADLAVGTTILFGDGLGGFGAGVTFESVTQQLLVVADVDRNGSPDLVGVDDGTGVNVLRTRIVPAGTRALPMRLTMVPNPSRYGEEVAVAANVTLSSLQVPAGRVGLFIDGDSLGSAPIVGGKAAFAVPFPVGSYAVHAEYRGDDHFAGVTADGTHTITRGDTEVRINSRPPAILRTGQLYAFNVSVTPRYPSKGDSPTGSVKLLVGEQLVQEVTLLPNITTTWSLSFSWAKEGHFDARLEYSGDANYLPSAIDAGVIDAVTRKPPAISAQASVSGADAEIAVTLRGDLGNKPVTGSVTFRSGEDVLGVVAVSAGKASLRLNGLSSGKHEVRVEYGGNDVYGVASSTVTFEIQGPGPRRRATRS